MRIVKETLDESKRSQFKICIRQEFIQQDTVQDVLDAVQVEDWIVEDQLFQTTVWSLNIGSLKRVQSELQCLKVF